MPFDPPLARSYQLIETGGCRRQPSTAAVVVNFSPWVLLTNPVAAENWSPRKNDWEPCCGTRYQAPHFAHKGWHFTFSPPGAVGAGACLNYNGRVKGRDLAIGIRHFVANVAGPDIALVRPIEHRPSRALILSQPATLSVVSMASPVRHSDAQRLDQGPQQMLVGVPSSN